MHADCFQSNTRYYADSELPVGDKYDPRLESTDPTHCQETCQTVAGAAAFTFDPSEDIPCICYGGNATLARYYRKGSTSGPTVCQSSSSYASSQTDEAKGEAPQVPMEQIFPCTKSPRVQTIEELETTFKQWTEECYLNASRPQSPNLILSTNALQHMWKDLQFKLVAAILLWTQPSTKRLARWRNGKMQSGQMFQIRMTSMRGEVSPNAIGSGRRSTRMEGGSTTQRKSRGSQGYPESTWTNNANSISVSLCRLGCNAF